MEFEKLANKAYKFSQAEIIAKFDKKLSKDVKDGFCMMLSLNWLLYAKRYQAEKDPGLTAMKILWGICSLDNLKQMPTEEAHMNLLGQIASQHRAFQDLKKLKDRELNDVSKEIVDVLVKQKAVDVDRYRVIGSLVYGKPFGLTEQTIELGGYEEGYQWRGIYDAILYTIDPTSTANYVLLSIRFKDGTGHAIGIFLDAPGKSARVFDPNFGMASALNCNLDFKGFKKGPKGQKVPKAPPDPNDEKKEKVPDPLKQVAKALAADYASSKLKKASLMVFDLK